MDVKPNGVLQGMAGVMIWLALTAGAQAQTPPAPAPAPAAPPTWSVGPIDFSGFIDGYYSYNANRPSNPAIGQINDLYNFNDKTDQFSLSAAKLTIYHDPDPVGVHVDLIWGRTNALIHVNSAAEQATANYLEQAFLSFKPNKVHGTEFDFGQFVTSAGAEVIEAKDDWNYSRSLLFVWAIPYYHFGLRSSVPVTKTWTAGVQLVNGWNNDVANNGGITVGLTCAYTKPRYVWNVNYYVGPSNLNTQNGHRNLIDNTLLLAPSSKLSAYINYDYGQNRIPATPGFRSASPHWRVLLLPPRGKLRANQPLLGAMSTTMTTKATKPALRKL
jgi:Putative beta-barrel porin-2, OmpL-like. bbp2